MCSFVSLNESITQHVNELLPQYLASSTTINGSLIITLQHLKNVLLSHTLKSFNTSNQPFQLIIPQVAFR